MRRNLDDQDLGDLLTGATLAILATRRADGSTMLSPVWHEWSDGGATIVIGSGDTKSRQLARDPRCTVLIAEQVPPYRTVELTGVAQISRPADLERTARRISVRYLGVEAGNAYADAMAASPMEQLRIVIERRRAWDFSDEIP